MEFHILNLSSILPFLRKRLREGSIVGFSSKTLYFAKKLKAMKREFIKYINALDEEDLVKELQKLYTKFPTIKKYYAMELSPSTDKIVAQYKTKIKKVYFKPNGGFGRAKSSVSRKIIAEFKRVAIHQSDVIELWVYRTEMMTKYVVGRNYYSETFFKSIAISYETTCKLIAKEKMETEFEPRCHEIIDSVSDFWGLPEELQWIYEQYFGNFNR